MSAKKKQLGEETEERKEDSVIGEKIERKIEEDYSSIKREKGKKICALLVGERVVTENSDGARELYNQNRYGALLEDGRVQLSFPEAYFLLEKEKIEIYDGRNRSINKENFLKKIQKIDPKFLTRYCVFKDIRNRGYIIKTALKFGADFRVYGRGIKPGEGHAKWIVYPVHESESSTWYEFAAKNRVAHSTKKRLLIGIVDDEGDVTYYEIRWTRP